MMCKFAKTNSAGAALRRAAIAGGLAASLLLTALTGASAQTTPYPNQTPQPTPYSWPGFHAGGTALYPFYDAAAPAVGTSPTNPGATPYQALSPLYSQLMGTPSGFLLLNGTGTLNPGTSIISEVSSFVLGNYNRLLPPAETIGDIATGTLSYFPNHFADDVYFGGFKTWSAPFTYLTSATSGQSIQSITDDNTSTTAQTYTGTNFGTANGWQVSFAGTGGFNGAVLTSTSAADNPIAPTGNPDYVRAAAAATATATATWAFKAPATATTTNPVAGLYTVSLHLPTPPVSGDANYPEARVPDAHYIVKNASTGVTLFDGKISQTETNDPQYLAGPFPVGLGQTITVTLDNSTASDLTSTHYVLADSVSLTPGSIAGGANAVNGSPTAINSTQYPEIQDVLYFGEITDVTVGSPTFGQRTFDNTNPYGNPTIGTPNPTTSNRVYQLVYFGRYETIILTDAKGNLVNASGVASTVPVTEQVGAVYCVNGINGDIVWRFQTPDVLTKSGTAALPVYTRSSGSQAVFTTPTVVRINVQVPQGTSPETYKPATKLVVIVADDNGQVYCLDAIGNRNGTSNTAVVGASGTASFTYNQPIYAPNAPLNTATTPDAANPHVGTTKIYWVYRPDQTKDLTSKLVRDYDATRDLPKPQAFGTASPTVYVDPTLGIDTTTLRPDVLSSAAALTSNAKVFIGNSNGTLYALDAGGVAVTPSATATPYLDSTDPYSTSRYVGISSFPITVGVPYTLTADGSPVPTAVPVWWFSGNGAQTNNTDATGNVGITSAPALRLTGDPAAGAPTTNSFSATPELYFTTANDTTNQGRVWAVPLTGPVKYAAAGAIGTALVPGTAGYNNFARPNWVFPNAYTNTGHGTDSGKIRPPLGSITGSPAVFTNPDDKTTRVYVAANSNEDDVAPADQGRVWAIRAFAEAANLSNVNSTSANFAGEAVWCYPDYYDPNVFAPTETLKAGTKTLGGNTYTTADLAPDPLGAFQYATPALGVVQFPTAINYGNDGLTQFLHTDNSANGNGNRTANDVRGENVPMLYVGSHIEAPDSSNFFALDLDGSNDNERNIFYDANSTVTPAPVGTTQGGAGFECSPLLIVNSTSNTFTKNTTPGQGNGGAVFLAGADNNLYEIAATPTSDIGANSTAPQILTTIPGGGFGPFSSPAAAAFSGSAIGGTATGGGAQDWVYGGDGKLGIARGITPSNLVGSGADGITLGTGGTGNDALAPTQVLLQFPLHAYIFDGKITGADAKGSGQTVNMNRANNINEALPAFEWGEPVYIRISNVVPPNDLTLNADGTFKSTSGSVDALSRIVTDSATGADMSTVYTNGGPITVQLSDVTDPGATTTVGETDSVTIPAVVLKDTPGLVTMPPGNGFLHRGGAGNQDGDGPSATASGDMLKDATNAWIGAGTYAIGDGSNRRNTPGARRRIVSAIQIAQAYTFDSTAKTYKFAGSVTLQVTVDSAANQYSTFGPVNPVNGTRTATGRRRLAPVDQPTFGILNPLAVQGGGYPLAVGANAPATPAAGAIPVEGTGTGILGPFGGVHSPLVAANTDDLGAYANGNRIPRATTDIPANGVVTGGRGTGGRRGQRPVRIITATGDINHGTTGDNADPVNINATPPKGNQGNATPGYLTAPNANAPYGPYALNVADRSALGAAGQQIHNLTVQAAALAWHDNSALGGSNVYGPGAMVNPLPWETEPTSGQAGTNTSLDYPDIGASRLSHVLMPFPGYTGATPATGGEITNQAGSLDPALGATAAARTVYADPLQVQVRVPTYQPANLQVYDQASTTGNNQITPDQLTGTSIAFPEGYVTNETVYVDSNHNRKFDPGEAYRTFRVFTGVPVAMSTTMDTTTIDLGRLPQGFGLDTDQYPALGAFMPYPTATQLGVNAQNPGYVQFFKPLHVSNRGNVNLLNVHLDQKVRIGTRDTPLPFRSDSLDLAAQLPAYDAGATLTGPRLVLPNTAGTPTGDGFGTFLLRSSLDDDLIRAYGRNPALVNDTNYGSLGATFHKARVGDPAPSVLTVPDVPRDNTIGYSGYIDAQNPMVPPVAIGNTLAMPGSVDSAGTGPATPTAAEPFIALTIPQGTPVGTYTQSVRLFEGVDPFGYKAIGPNVNNTYIPILPPQYGNHQINPVLGNPMGGVAYTPPPGDDYNGNGLINTWMLNTDGSPLQPASSAAVIKATVTEGRITDGASKGSLPQVDQQGANAGTGGARLPAADFLPSAFRDPLSGHISLYWTSSRGATATSPYTLVGANLDFTNGYFSPNTTSNWWTPIGASLAPAAGLNSSISAFTGDGGTYAFVQNVTGGGTTPVVNNLLCYPVTAQSGALSSTAVPVSQNTSQSSFGAHGLVFDVNKFAGVTKGFPDAYPNTTQSAITNNVWGFWYGGARGRSSIYYSSVLSTSVDAYKKNDPTPFSATALLPIPAGLASVSDPNAVLSYAPDPAGSTQPVPVIEVTYTGIAADGNADIYVSRYRPYFVRDAQGNIVIDPNDPSKTRKLVALALLPSPTITEQLQGTDGNLYYQARDVAWASPYYTPKTGGGFIVANSVDVSVNGTGLNLVNAQPKLDRATNTLVYANVTLPNVGGKATSGPGTVYIDLARGRVRFSPQYPTASGASVYAVFNAQARRITTDSRADTAPISFIDTSYKFNEADRAGAALGRVETDRYWYIWRKSGAPGTSTTPTLYYKTQRLTVDLQLRDKTTGQPIGIKLDANKKPLINVSGGLYTQGTGGVVDVDWVRGRVYFPIVNGTTALEGQSVTITGTDTNGASFTVTDTVHWLDEPRYNSPSSPTIAAGTSPTGQTAFTATATGDAAIPIDTIVNESNVTAFLDPVALNSNTATATIDVTPKVWLFWNSTRNGTADLYYETISPLFSATTGN